MKEAFRNFFVIVIVLAAPVLLLSFFTHIVAFDTQFQANQLARLRVPEQFPSGVANEEAARIVGYLHGDTVLNREFLNDREIAHLVDVKALLTKNKRVAIIAAVVITVSALIIACMRKWVAIASAFKWAGIFTTLLLCLMLVALSVGFESLFITFHEITFSNDLWMLDPATDNLIVLFPAQFFVAVAMRIFLLAIVAAVALGGCGWMVEWILKQKLIYADS